MAKRNDRVPVCNVVPDRLDLRDRLYMPSVRCCPDQRITPRFDLPVLDQEQTNACTGFALATVVNFLLRRRAEGESSTPPAEAVSPHMLYSMARRYDEIPGSTGDTGSTLRAAMKGWYKHGVCRGELWNKEPMPKAAKTPEHDWWLDAAKRPLGAYYRLEVKSVTDMHVALQEVGILYASALSHSGWAEGFGVGAGEAGRFWRIPRRPSSASDGGHAFAIVGYDDHGFLVQNSWGQGWGTSGIASLSYDDWLANAMDAWVAQPGVVTERHLEIARSVSLRTRGGVVQLAPDEVLRNREISPFIVDMENNGVLSTTGEFRTQPSDVRALTTIHVEQARKTWRLAQDEPMDVAIYAHGGLVGEQAAAATAAQWIPALYDSQIFPIFLMWETDLLTTLKEIVEEVISGQPRPAGGLESIISQWWNQRLEGLLRGPGAAVWAEIKENAEMISAGKGSAGQVLYEESKKSPWFKPGLVRLHLIGHSAGAIVVSHIVDALCRRGWRFESVNFMAPAVRVDTFESLVLPQLKSGKVRRLNEFHLSEVAEQADPTCKPILGYSRSLLHLVSRSFEGGVETPILGMQRHFDAASAGWKTDAVKAFVAPSSASESTTHGGFDDDETTRAKVIALIKGPATGVASGARRPRTARSGRLAAATD